MNDYEKYERECRAVRAENEMLLHQFKAWLEAAGLSETTINRHRVNVDFYINEFLLYYDVTRAHEGAASIGMFLGYWFNRKAAWVSGPVIKANAASLKKFYTFMCERGYIEQSALQFLKTRIKNDMAEWIAKAERW